MAERGVLVFRKEAIVGGMLRHEADEHFVRGNSLDEEGDRAGAISEWLEAIHLDPDHASAHYNLGVAYWEEEALDLAVSELREAIRLDPFEMDGRRALAQVYLQQDDVDAAVNQLRQVLNATPGDDEAARLLAGIFLDQGKYDEAAGALESGAMTEDDADLWCELGDAFAGEGRWEDSILSYRRALICKVHHNKAEMALQRMHVPLEEPPDVSEEEESADI